MEVDGSDSLMPCHGVEIEVLGPGCELLAAALDGPVHTKSPELPGTLSLQT